VQVEAEPIGAVFSALRARLDGWLGSPRRDFSECRVTLTYRFEAEGVPPVRLKLKAEINSREHFSIFGLREHPFAVRSRWYEGEARLLTYSLEELLGTKLRALYQRRKGRDLFDLWDGLERGEADPDRIVQAFLAYLQAEVHPVSRAEFEENLAGKAADANFLHDVAPLLATGVAWRPREAVEIVSRELTARLPGEAWRRVGPGSD